MIPPAKEARLMLSANADWLNAACVISCWAGTNAGDVRIETGGPNQVFVVNSDWCTGNALAFQGTTNVCPLPLISAVPTPVDGCRGSDCVRLPSFTINTSADPTITINIAAQGSATFSILWGDGTALQTGKASGNSSHTYGAPGVYDIYVTNETTHAQTMHVVTVTHATLVLTPSTDRTVPVGTAISTVQMSAAGAVAPITWSATGLPTGLSLNTSTGAITGTPTRGQAATNSTVTATDSAGNTGSVTFKWTCTTAVTVASISAQNWTSGSAITNVTGSATDTDTSITTFTWSISPALPSAVTLNTSTGVISGTPAASAAVRQYTLTATDSLGAAGSTQFNVTVA